MRDRLFVPNLSRPNTALIQRKKQPEMNYQNVIAITLLMLGSAIAQADERPNIVVFYTDDHGHADLSCQGVLDDIRTPHVDALARSGVRAIHGYSTAPQCVPSRAGLLVGKFQAKFGLESNGYPMDGFNKQTTFAKRLQSAGYKTAQFGKWHLGPGPQITKHGFDHVFNQNSQGKFYANIDLDGKDRPMGITKPEMYHVDGCSRAAAAVIKRYADQPFLLYVAYRAPHVPLDATQKYLDRFPGEMPERRRQCLAMLSAVDDGVGLVMKTLADNNLTEKTLVFYIGDNGAPLKIHKRDAPGGGPGWDGSLNTPLNGEKGMLAEGGIHTPFVVSFPGTIAGGQQYPHPVSALDVAATATALANVKTEPEDLDGINLIPFLSGANQAAPHDALMWRWIAQTAIREGDWKLLRGGDREYLFNLKNDIEEKHNVAAQYPEITERLRTRLKSWAAELSPPGLENGKMAKAWTDYFDFYLDGKPAPTRGAPKTNSNKPKVRSDQNELGVAVDAKGWIARNGEIVVQDGQLSLGHGKKGKGQAPFLVRNQLNLAGPVTATVRLKSSEAGELAFAWREDGQQDFLAASRVAIKLAASEQWQTHEIKIPAQSDLIHLRVQMPAEKTRIVGLKLIPSSGKTVTLW